MQKVKFSETQFAFNFINELIRKNPAVGMPFFPDTVNEGKFYGFDVCVGNYFFQFKKSNLFDINDSPQKFWDSIGQENYFKIQLNTDGKQFKFLKRLSKMNNRFNKVLYSTPAFHTRTDLKRYYTNATIIDNSALFSLNDFDDSISGYHYLIHKSNSNQGLLFSNPIEIVKSNLDLNFEENIKNKLSIYDMARKIRYECLGDTTDSKFEILNDNKPIDFIRAIRSTLLVDYNTFWFPIININSFFEQLNNE